MRAYYSLCFASLIFGCNNIGNRDPIAILQTAVSSVIKIITLTLQDRLFQKAYRDEHFDRLVYSTDVRWLSIGSCMTTFVLLPNKAMKFLQAKGIILRNSLMCSWHNEQYY